MTSRCCLLLAAVPVVRAGDRDALWRWDMGGGVGYMKLAQLGGSTCLMSTAACATGGVAQTQLGLGGGLRWLGHRCTRHCLGSRDLFSSR